MSTIVELDIDVIAQERDARAVLRAVAGVPGLKPLQYDLNGRGSFRAWDVERGVVDLLTQRTQLFAIEGAGGTALVATGKHGEPPTVAFTMDVDHEVLRELFAELDVRNIRSG